MSINELTKKLLSIKFNNMSQIEKPYIYMSIDVDNQIIVCLESEMGIVWLECEDGLIANSGRGKTVEEAMNDYYNQILGKTLVIQNIDDFGEVLEEYKSNVIE